MSSRRTGGRSEHSSASRRSHNTSMLYGRQGGFSPPSEGRSRSDYEGPPQVSSSSRHSQNTSMLYNRQRGYSPPSDGPSPPPADERCRSRSSPSSRDTSMLYDRMGGFDPPLERSSHRDADIPPQYRDLYGPTRMPSAITFPPAYIYPRPYDRAPRHRLRRSHSLPEDFQNVPCYSYQSRSWHTSNCDEIQALFDNGYVPAVMVRTINDKCKPQNKDWTPRPDQSCWTKFWKGEEPGILIYPGTRFKSV